MTTKTKFITKDQRRLKFNNSSRLSHCVLPGNAILHIFTYQQCKVLLNFTAKYCLKDFSVLDNTAITSVTLFYRSLITNATLSKFIISNLLETKMY